MSPVVTDQLMTIGAFARQSRLSLKALRLYDELGLLRPAAVDESTGYRYYNDTQIERARLVGLLRRLEMALERIGRVLSVSPSEQVEDIARYWREVESSVAVKQRLVAYLERYLEGRGDVMYQVHTRQVPEQRVLTVSRHVKQPELVRFMMEAAGQVYSALEGTSAKTDSPWFAVFHGVVDADSDGPVEICLPFVGTIEAPAGMQVRIEPAHHEAFTTVDLEHTSSPTSWRPTTPSAATSSRRDWNRPARRARSTSRTRQTWARPIRSAMLPGRQRRFVSRPRAPSAPES